VEGGGGGGGVGVVWGGGGWWWGGGGAEVHRSWNLSGFIGCLMKMTQFVRRCNSLLHWSFYCPCSRR